MGRVILQLKIRHDKGIDERPDLVGEFRVLIVLVVFLVLVVLVVLFVFVVLVVLVRGSMGDQI